MKIAIIADPFIPIPPIYYGGIERIIDFLVSGLISLGHEVVIVAHKDSDVNAKHIPYGNQETALKHFHNILNIYQIQKFKPDIIHSFGRLAYLLPFLNSDTPKLMSYQRSPTISQIKKAMFLAKNNTINFTGCSNYISQQIKPYAPCFTIFNGIELSKYDFNKAVEKDAPLVFLGRIEPIKGTHIAIDIAIKTGKKLIVAGNIPPEQQDYFNTQIATRLNEDITYIGPVNDKQKNDLLGAAIALLMPINWEEPFGIVMAEAMACGTPVIALNKGAVPELIIEGYNGFLCNSIEQMITAVVHCHEISRINVRLDAENRFSSTVIVNQYVALYSSLINKN